MDEAARDAVMSLQGDVAYFRSTVQVQLETLAGHGRVEVDPTVSQGGPTSGSVDPRSGSLDIVVVCMLVL